MPSVSYTYDVNQLVWTIDVIYGVRQAVVKAVTFDATAANVIPPVKYSVIYTKTSAPSQDLIEDYVFSDIDLALAAYKLLIT